MTDLAYNAWTSANDTIIGCSIGVSLVIILCTAVLDIRITLQHRRLELDTKTLLEELALWTRVEKIRENKEEKRDEKEECN